MSLLSLQCGLTNLTPSPNFYVYFMLSFKLFQFEYSLVEHEGDNSQGELKPEQEGVR